MLIFEGEIMHENHFESIFYHCLYSFFQDEVTSEEDHVGVEKAGVSKSRKTGKRTAK